MWSKLLTAGVTIIWLDLCVGVSCCDCDVNGWLSSPFSYESSIWGGDISMAVCCFLICVAELYGGTSSGSGIDNCANNDCNAKCIEKKKQMSIEKINEWIITVHTCKRTEMISSAKRTRWTMAEAELKMAKYTNLRIVPSIILCVLEILVASHAGAGRISIVHRFAAISAVAICMWYVVSCGQSSNRLSKPFPIRYRFITSFVFFFTFSQQIASISCFAIILACFVLFVRFVVVRWAWIDWAKPMGTENCVVFFCRKKIPNLIRRIMEFENFNKYEYTF